jgi:hypothetical protein
MHTYLIESEIDLKELCCNLPLKNLVEFQKNIKSILQVDADKIENLNADYFLAKKLNLKEKE